MVTWHALTDTHGVLEFDGSAPGLALELHVDTGHDRTLAVWVLENGDELVWPVVGVG